MTALPSRSTTSISVTTGGTVRAWMSACRRSGSVVVRCRGRAPVTRPSSSTPTTSTPPAPLARHTTASTSSVSCRGSRSSPLNSTVKLSPPCTSRRTSSGGNTDTTDTALPAAPSPRAALLSRSGLSPPTCERTSLTAVRQTAGASPVYQADARSGPGWPPQTVPAGFGWRRQRQRSTGSSCSSATGGCPGSEKTASHRRRVGSGSVRRP